MFGNTTKLKVFWKNGEICDSFGLDSDFERVEEVTTLRWFDVHKYKEEQEKDPMYRIHLENYDRTPKSGRILQITLENPFTGVIHKYLYNSDYVCISFS